MGRKVLLAVISWLAFSQACGEPKNEKLVSVIALDNISEESAPRLYRKSPLSVYASAVPHFSHKIRGHSVIAASSQIAPVKANSNQGLTNLKDSYGKYVQTHQSAYTPPYPQQFVPLQDLPPHLAQPLVSAAAPSFNFKAAPNYFYGPHGYKVQELQLPVNHAIRFGSISQPLVSVNDLKSFAPSHLHEVHTPEHKITYTHSNQPSYHQIDHSKQASQHTNHQTYASKYQKPSSQVNTFIKDTKQQGSHHQPGQIQASPAQTRVTAIVNGKKTVVNLETKPPVPFLDLNLLEPLKFDNPLVPQLQHFLPKIKGVSYHKLPTYNDKKGKNKEIVITKMKSYDSGFVNGKTFPGLKKDNKSQTPNKSSKPGISVKGYPNSGDYSYEINTPNHKETYNEQVIKYNTETNMKPVEFSYNEQTRKEPEVYTFVHSSKEPLKVVHTEYNSDDNGPKHLVYNLSPEEENEESSHKVNEPAPRESAEESNEEIEENSSESHKDGPSSHSSNLEKPSQGENDEYDAHHNVLHNTHKHPEQLIHRAPAKEYHHHSEHNIESPKHQPQHGYSHSSNLEKPSQGENDEYDAHHNVLHNTHKHPEQLIHRAPAKEYHHHSEHNIESPKHQPQHGYSIKSESPVSHNLQHNSYVKSQGSPPKRPQQNLFILQETPKNRVNHHALSVEHRAQEYNKKTLQDANPQFVQSVSKPLNKFQVVQSFLKPIALYQPITPEYEEDIRLLPTHVPHASPIKVEPGQHLPVSPTVQTYYLSNNGAPEGKNNIISQQMEFHSPPQPHSSQEPHVEEKSRHIIIKETQDLPEEKQMHIEQGSAEMSDKEENNEEDFEKSYKESAIGFPAYDAVAEDVEKDIFDPDSYGTPHYHNEYNIDHSPFQQYQKDHDKFPKFARLAYKDSRDNNQEDYFLDYGVHKPESYTDRIKSKVEYYKMFKNNKPERVYIEQDDDKKEKSAKFTIAPSFDFFKSAAKPKQSKNLLLNYKMGSPIQYEYEFNQEAPRDSSAYASRPTFNKHKTLFVEPQLQYGFDPITAPVVFAESEMAAVASNDSPDSENLGTRKKVYREKWYMKKTSTNSKPS